MIPGMPASFTAFWLKLRTRTIQTFSNTASAMHQLKREMDRALRARWQKVAPKAFGTNDKHRATERAIHPRQLETTSIRFERESSRLVKPRKPTTATCTGV